MSTVIFEEEWSPSKGTSDYKPEKLARYSYNSEASIFNRDAKETIPLNIINNKEGESVYKDLKLEVFVKAEAEIKNFVQNFNLSQLSNFIFEYYNVPYYVGSLWVSGYNYSIKDIVYDIDYFGKKNYYICLVSHTSSDFFTDYFVHHYWHNINDANEFLYIEKNIDQSWYNSNFPYVAKLVFKNLWGMEIALGLVNLKTYTKKVNFLMDYPKLFSKNLRSSTFEFTKFFDQGYIKESRFVLGESFNNDNILGETKLNNYFNISENSHDCPEGWNANSDSVVINSFGRTIYNPFDHYYQVLPSNTGIPFFKEKIFTDNQISLILEKEDKLGNIYQRKVYLPIYTLFTNNLIKAYWYNSRSSITDGIFYEYLSSTNTNRFNTNSSTDIEFWAVIWCPNVKRLTLSSSTTNAIFGVYPKIRGLSNILNIPPTIQDELSGQFCILEFKFSFVDDNLPATFINIFEYSEGENYDKFIFNVDIRKES